MAGKFLAEIKKEFEGGDEEAVKVAELRMLQQRVKIIDKQNRNYYNYRGFEHLARNCRNRRIRSRIEKGKRLEYRRNK